MEIYGGVDLHPGDRLEVEFQNPDGMRVAGVVRNRSGFCFGLELDTVQAQAEPTPPGGLESYVLETLIVQRHEEFLRHAQQNINHSLQMALEMRKFRAEIELFAEYELLGR